MKKNLVFLIRLLAMFSILTALSLNCSVSGQEKTEKKNSSAAIDALGELLRGLNNLSGGKKVLPTGDPFLEKVRTRYEIPERVEIIAPHGGTTIIAFIYDNEHLPVMAGIWTEIYPGEYRYLQTYHNLKAVYCLHEKEPVDLGDIIVAIKPDYGGQFSVYFNDKRGTIEAARISAGNAVLFSSSKYIVKPVLF